jgi:phage gp16-like protein
MSDLMCEERNNLLARIHILKKQIQMSDKNYRFLLSEYFQVETASDLAVGEMRRVISTLEAYGNVQGKISKQDSLIFQLWQELFEQGKTGSGSRDSLNRWIKRQTQVERLEWLTTRQKAKLIEALKAWKRRPHKSS